MKSLLLNVGFGVLVLALSGCGGAAPGGQTQATEAGVNAIIGGRAIARQNEIASMTVGLLTSTQRGSSLCTASIITDDLAITAGHCVRPTPATMRLVFRRDMRAPVRGDLGPTVRVTGYIRHPQYGKGDQKADTDMNDIALVSFAGGLPAGFKPATILSDERALTSGARVRLAGYGTTTGDPTVDEGNAGTGLLRAVDTIIQEPMHGTSEVTVDQTQGRGACHGDSGGPAYLVAEDGSLQLFGVTSRGPADKVDDCASVGIYTNILAHIVFVVRAANNLRAGITD